MKRWMSLPALAAAGVLAGAGASANGLSSDEASPYGGARNGSDSARVQALGSGDLGPESAEAVTLEGEVAAIDHVTGAFVLNTATSYAVTQPFARTIAELLERDHPRLVTAEMARSARSGRVFVGWSQNAQHKTTVAVYSLRAKHERPLVSMPVPWEELRRAAKAGDPAQLYFGPKAALTRLARRGDLFRPVLTHRQTLPAPFTAQLAAVTA